MCFHKAACHIALSLGAFLVFSPPSLAQTAQSTPETVLTTFRVKPAQLSAFLNHARVLGSAARSEFSTRLSAPRAARRRAR